MINKDEMIKRVAFATNAPRDMVKGIMESLFMNMIEALRKEETIRFVDFGTFSTRTRKGRIGVNPRNPSQPINIPDVRVVKFKPSHSLKKIVKNG